MKHYSLHRVHEPDLSDRRLRYICMAFSNRIDNLEKVLKETNPEAFKIFESTYLKAQEAFEKFKKEIDDFDNMIEIEHNILMETDPVYKKMCEGEIK